MGISARLILIKHVNLVDFMCILLVQNSLPQCVAVFVYLFILKFREMCAKECGKNAIPKSCHPV